MGFVKALVGFGVGIIGFGFYWMLFNDVLNNFFAKYVLQNEYYELSNLFWQGMPIVCMLVGVLALVLAGLSRRGTKVVHYE